MAKFGWRDGKLWAKDVKVENAPEFSELDGTDVVVVINGVKRKVSTSSI
jgi:malate/lactate dehydrogenase